MSSSSVEQTVVEEVVCASCGITGGDDVKLKLCTACKLVKYCSVECQKNHRPQHKKSCKKRMAEIRDDRLFTLPDESHLGECPICCLPVPLDLKKSSSYPCCSKFICMGCCYANVAREKAEGLKEPRCPYCRESLLKTEEEADQNYMKRVKANDPVALRQLGGIRSEEGDLRGRFNISRRQLVWVM